MKLQAPANRPNDSDNNLIPMINVVFLLLIFFMVAGAIRASDPVALEPLESRQQQDLTVPVTLYMASDGKLVLKDTVVSIDRLAAALTSANSSEAKLEKIPPLALKADPRVSIADLRTLLGTLREAGISDVELVTTHVPTPPATTQP